MPNDRNGSENESERRHGGEIGFPVAASEKIVARKYKTSRILLDKMLAPVAKRSLDPQHRIFEEAPMNVFQGLLLIFLTLPILEIWLLLTLGGVIGFLPTLILLLGAAGLGSYLLQTQGWSAWMRLQQSLARGEAPAEDLLNGAMIVAGGALLLLPGFMSDIAGMLCLLPFTRRRIAAWLVNSRLRAVRPEDAQGPKTIEGEFRRED